MAKTVVVSVISALITAALLWLVGVTAKLFSTVTIPPNAVMAFSQDECPEGWEDYSPAYGRFVRGIDKSGTNIDPDGQRVPDTHQDDTFKSHSHNERPATGNVWFQVYQRNTGGTWPNEKIGNTQLGPSTSSEGGAETRPRNVALLFCEKN